MIRIILVSIVFIYFVSTREDVSVNTIEIVVDDIPFTSEDAFDFVYDVIISSYEGAYSNHEDDKGGETLWGVSSVMQDAYWVPESQYDAASIMMMEFYNRQGIHRLFDAGYPSVGLYTLDFSINAGYNGIKSLQRIVGAKADGGLGKETMDLVFDYIESNGEAKLLAEMVKARLKFYKNLDDSITFGNGWKRRAKKIVADIESATIEDKCLL